MTAPSDTPEGRNARYFEDWTQLVSAETRERVGYDTWIPLREYIEQQEALRAARIAWMRTEEVTLTECPRCEGQFVRDEDETAVWHQCKTCWFTELDHLKADTGE